MWSSRRMKSRTRSRSRWNAGKRAPALDDKAGWIKKVSVEHLPPRFRLGYRPGRSKAEPRKLAYVFIEYLEQRAGGAAVPKRAAPGQKRAAPKDDDDDAEEVMPKPKKRGAPRARKAPVA
jgi:hypothetical protein